MEPIPNCDKWILYFGDTILSNGMIRNGNYTYSIDFSKVSSDYYKQHAKYWFWNFDASLYRKTTDLRTITDSLNYIYDLKTGKELSIYTTPSQILDISLNDIVAWKNHVLSCHTNNRTRNHIIYAFRGFIKFLNDSELCHYESGVFFHLTHNLDQSYSNANAIPDDELTKLAIIMKEKRSENVLSALCCSAFFIAIETEFRPSHILTLHRNCVKETAKQNEYVLVSREKTSAGKFYEYPITEYTKREIDEIIRITDSLREQSTITNLKDFLFIVPQRRKGQFEILSENRFNSYLKKCCKLAGIPEYSISNLRDTHMTKAEEEIIRKSLSDTNLRILTGHKHVNSDRPYIDTDIRTMLEAVHGIIIGNVSLDGNIIETGLSIKPENEVSNSCGYCSSCSCDDYSYLDCLLCKHFVTTPDRLPFFQEQIKQLDIKLKSATCNHDREDLINIKRILLRYTEKIMEYIKEKS